MVDMNTKLRDNNRTILDPERPLHAPATPPSWICRFLFTVSDSDHGETLPPLEGVFDPYYFAWGWVGGLTAPHTFCKNVLFTTVITWPRSSMTQGWGVGFGLPFLCGRPPSPPFLIWFLQLSLVHGCRAIQLFHQEVKLVSSHIVLNNSLHCLC